MALSQDRYTTHVVARIEEYMNDSVPWQRSLWQLGTFLVLKEVVEYADQLRRGAIKDEGVRYVCQAAKEQCSKDPAVQGTAVGNRLDALLGNPKDFKNEYISAELEHLANRVDQGYFGRLASVLRSAAEQPSAERISRFIAAHLLASALR